MSSSKQYNLQPSLVINEDSVAGDVRSLVTEVLNKDNITYQLKWDGDLDALFEVHVSSDYNPNNPSAAHWDSLPLDPAPTASGSADTWTIELNQIGSKYVSLFVVYNSGTSNLQAYVSGKAI